MVLGELLLLRVVDKRFYKFEFEEKTFRLLISCFSQMSTQAVYLSFQIEVKYPPDPVAPQSSMSRYSVNVEVDLSKPLNFPVPKRTKFPSVPSFDQVLQYESNHADDDIQR